MEVSYKLIDVFAGAGGMTLGFTQAGFMPVLAIEKDKDSATTYAANFGAHVLRGKVEDIIPAGGVSFPADVVVGGPPCQGFSNLTGNRLDDPRRHLWRYFMEVVASSECKVFVVENVPNLLTSPEGHALIKKARQLGFFVNDDSTGVVRASEFGVPQNRRRALIIGSRLGPITLPATNGKRMSVREAFRGIPLQPRSTVIEKLPVSGRSLHIGRVIPERLRMRYAAIPPGGNRFHLQERAPELTPPCWLKKKDGSTDLCGRIEWEGPARCTIRCEFYKAEKGRYLHPSEDRPITHWEAARLQTFPDSFKWYGSKTSIAVQIGNAVPPLLARSVAEHIRLHLKSHRSRPARKPRPGELQPTFAWT